MRHTPGPWNFEKHENFVVYVGNNEICELYEGDQEANARLIAAAPELLEACEYVVKWHRENDTGEGELYGLDFVTTCICAIKKAKGE